MRRALPVLLLVLAGCGERAPAAPEAASAPRSEPPLRLRQAPDAPKAAPDGRWTTARVVRRAAVRTAPDGRLAAWIGRRTEFGGPRVVSVLRRRRGWLQVVVPERPDDRPGWIRASAVRLGGTDVSLHIDRSARRLTVRDGRRVRQRITVGVGAPGHQTPTGRYAITDKLRMGGPGTTYGCCALALSAHQRDLPAAWPGSDRVAIHGTRSPETIGQAASLGCVHASERALRRMMREVPVGAPVFVRA